MILTRRMIAALALALAAGSAHAQTGAAVASLNIRDAVGVSTLQRMAFASRIESIAPSASGMVDAIGVIQVASDPGRSYRIQLPRFVTAEGHAVVETISARSRSGGEVSGAQAGSTNTDGRDVVEFESRLRLPAEFRGGQTTAMPLSVEVE